MRSRVPIANRPQSLNPALKEEFWTSYEVSEGPTQSRPSLLPKTRIPTWPDPCQSTIVNQWWSRIPDQPWILGSFLHEPYLLALQLLRNPRYRNGLQCPPCQSACGVALPHHKRLSDACWSFRKYVAGRVIYKFQNLTQINCKWEHWVRCIFKLQKS